MEAKLKRFGPSKIRITSLARNLCPSDYDPSEQTAVPQTPAPQLLRSQSSWDAKRYQIIMFMVN